MSAEEVHQQANHCHHFRGQPAISTWLSSSRSKLDGERLHALGNMVLPRCATLAWNVLVAATVEDH